MNITRGAASLSGLAMLLCTVSVASAQSEPEGRRAVPLDQAPVKRALPADDSIDRVLRSLKNQDTESPARCTIWRYQNIKNISMITPGGRAGPTRISR